MEAKLSCQFNHNQVGLISINFIWSHINFSKPGMKNFKAGRKLKKNSKQKVAGCSGAADAGCSGAAAAGCRNSEFRYALFFAIIAKVTVHSENQNFRYAQIFAKLAKFR